MAPVIPKAPAEWDAKDVPAALLSETSTVCSRPRRAKSGIPVDGPEWTIWSSASISRRCSFPARKLPLALEAFGVLDAESRSGDETFDDEFILRRFDALSTFLALGTPRKNEHFLTLRHGNLSRLAFYSWCLEWYYGSHEIYLRCGKGALLATFMAS